MTQTTPFTGDKKMQVKVTNKDFKYTTKYLKKNGYTFDGSTKAWSGDKDISFLVEDGYVSVLPQVSSMERLYDDMMNNPNSHN